MDKYLETKKKLAKLMGYSVLLVSFKLSADGFGFRTEDSLFIGWILAFAVTTAQLIFNTSVRKLNWTIVVVGVVSYAYSIWTNIMGFYVYRGAEEIVWDLSVNTVISVFGGLFVDVFPEMSLAWGYNAGQDGDLIGNLAKLGQVDEKTKDVPVSRHETENVPEFMKNGWKNGNRRQ